jgi:hypothetical protein
MLLPSRNARPLPSDKDVARTSTSIFAPPVDDCNLGATLS